MTPKRISLARDSFLVCCGLALLCFVAQPCVAETANQSLNYYFVDAFLVSLNAKESLASFKDEGHVSGTPGTTIGSSTPTTEISIELNTEAGRFTADVTTRNRKKPADRKTQRYDLSNLHPVSLEVETDKDGRTYLLNLVPTVKSARVISKSFQSVANEMYQLRFHSSRVTLNDKQYVGNMLASDSEFFNVEIIGLASIEFSLRHLKDAKPWGTLHDGQIRIAKPSGDFLTISNVTNGLDNRVVSGGPYTVWVRWKQSQGTVEEYRSVLKAQRELLAKDSSPDRLNDTNSMIIARIDRELSREPGPWIISCGAHSLQKNEFIHDE